VEYENGGVEKLGRRNIIGYKNNLFLFLHINHKNEIRRFRI
jgi:hypothetical protein